MFEFNQVGIIWEKNHFPKGSYDKTLCCGDFWS